MKEGDKIRWTSPALVPLCETSASVTQVKVVSVPCSPVGPSPPVSPHNSQCNSSVASSPGLTCTGSPITEIATSGNQPHDKAAEDALLHALHHTHREATRLFLMATRHGSTDAQIAHALRLVVPHLTDPDTRCDNLENYIEKLMAEIDSVRQENSIKKLMAELDSVRQDLVVKDKQVKDLIDQHDVSLEALTVAQKELSYDKLKALHMEVNSMVQPSFLSGHVKKPPALDSHDVAVPWYDRVADLKKRHNALKAEILGVKAGGPLESSSGIPVAKAHGTPLVLQVKIRPNSIDADPLRPTGLFAIEPIKLGQDRGHAAPSVALKTDLKESVHIPRASSLQALQDKGPSPASAAPSPNAAQLAVEQSEQVQQQLEEQDKQIQVVLGAPSWSTKSTKPKQAGSALSGNIEAVLAFALKEALEGHALPSHGDPGNEHPTEIPAISEGPALPSNRNPGSQHPSPPRTPPPCAPRTCPYSSAARTSAAPPLAPCSKRFLF